MGGAKSKDPAQFHVRGIPQLGAFPSANKPYT